MAAGTKLELSFIAGDGGTVRYSYNYAKSNATKANVVALAEFMISNKTYFNSHPSELKGAKTITTTENIYDLDSIAKEFPDFANKIAHPSSDRVIDVDSETPEVKVPEGTPAGTVRRLR